MSLKKIVLTLALLTTLNANANTQNSQQIPVDLQLLRLKKEVELRQRIFDAYQNKVTTAQQNLLELLRNNDQPRTATEQEKYDEEFAELSKQLNQAQCDFRFAGYSLNAANHNLTVYEHPIRSVIAPVVIGTTVVLGFVGGSIYLASK